MDLRHLHISLRPAHTGTMLSIRLRAHYSVTPTVLPHIRGHAPSACSIHPTTTLYFPPLGG